MTEETQFLTRTQVAERYWRQMGANGPIQARVMLDTFHRAGRGPASMKVGNGLTTPYVYKSEDVESWLGRRK